MERSKQIVQNLLEKIADEQQYNDPNINVKAISSEGANFTTFLFEGTITANGKDNLDLFIKVAAAGQEVRARYLIKVFENEVFFYTELLPKLKKIENDHDIKEKDRLIVPKLYGFHPTLYEETLALENLTKKGYTSYGRTESISWEYASTALTELAKLHALSFVLAAEDPEMYQKAKAKSAWTAKPDFFEVMFGSAVKRALAVMNEEYKPQFTRYITKFLKLENVIEHLSPNGKHMMLRHGDFRASNLMHKYNEDGSLSLVAVDYQMVQPGNPLADILFLIFNGTDADFRAKYWEKIFEHYYTQLSAALQRFGLNPEEKYSKKDFYTSKEEIMPYGIIVTLTVLAIVTVEQTPELGHLEPESFGKVETGQLYQERLNGIVADYIRWGYMD